MGMDGVEIVMAVEDAFSIEIGDSEAEKVQTPRDLIELVTRKVALATSSICLSHRAFNISRRSIQDFGAPRRKIRPTTHLADLIPREKRREFLTRVFQEIGSTEEELLKRPEWLPIVLFAASVLAGFAVTIVINPGTFFGMFATLTGTCVADGWIAAKLTEACRTEFPKDLQTAGEFSRWLMGRIPGLADHLGGGWTHEQIATRVREIVVEILGCEKEYREDARFIQDLGLS